MGMRIIVGVSGASGVGMSLETLINNVNYETLAAEHRRQEKNIDEIHSAQSAIDDKHQKYTYPHRRSGEVHEDTVG